MTKALGQKKIEPKLVGLCQQRGIASFVDIEIICQDVDIEIWEDQEDKRLIVHFAKVKGEWRYRFSDSLALAISDTFHSETCLNMATIELSTMCWFMLKLD